MNDFDEWGELPSDVMTERHVLGAMMTSENVIPEVYQRLGDPVDGVDSAFYLPAHQVIYAAIMAVNETVRPDPVLVAKHLEDAGELKRVGGALYLHTLIEGVPVVSSAAKYAEILVEKRAERGVVQLGQQLMQARDPEVAAALVSRWTENAELSAARSPSRRVRSQPLTQIKRRRRKSLWQDRVPLGELTLWVGHAGIGKSQGAVWMASRLTRGELPGELYGQPSPVLYLGTEDSWEYTLAPRFDAAGADPEKVFRLYVQTEDDGEGVVNLAVDLDTLRWEIEATGARLVVLDALLSTFGGAKLTEQGVVRRHLEPLARLAQELEIAVVGVAHFRKASDSNPLHMISGSSEFGQVVRSAIGFAPDRESEDGSCILSLIKTNIAPSGLPGLRYRVESCTVQTDEGPTDVGRFVLLGETEQSIEDVLNREHTSAEDRSERDECVEWLLNYLLGQKPPGEAPRSEVMKAARAEGFSVSTVNRAKVRARVRHASGGFPRTTMWIHPDFATNSDDPQSSHPSGTTGEKTVGETTGDDWSDQRKRALEEAPDIQSSQGCAPETTEAESGSSGADDATQGDAA